MTMETGRCGVSPLEGVTEDAAKAVAAGRGTLPPLESNLLSLPAFKFNKDSK